MIDNYILQSLADYIDSKVYASDGEQVITDILSLLAKEPEILDGRTWQQIRHVAEAYAGRENPFS